MLKRLTAHGNSLALVIEKPVLKLLNITSDTALDISTDGTRIIVSPVNGRRQGKVLRAVSDRIKRTRAINPRALMESPGKSL